MFARNLCGNQNDGHREPLQRYAGDVRRFALYLCGDVAMANEITADTFVRAWMAAGRIRQSTVKSYLFTIARKRVYRFVATGRTP